MSIQLGVAPIAWSNDDLPSLGGDTPLEVCLRESREAGYSGTETGGKFPMDPKTLGPLLESHELRLVSGWFSGELLEGSVDREIERMGPQLETFAALGAPVMVYAETTGSTQSLQDVPLSRRPAFPEDRWQDYGDKLTELARYMARQGVRMAFHHHMGTVIEKQHELESLLAHTGDEVGVVLDSGHMVFAGGEVEPVIRRHGHRINHVHCKDIRLDVMRQALAEDWSFLDSVLAGVFTVPGDGGLDFASYAKELAAIGYSGWVVVEAEQDPAKAPPLEYARKGREHLLGVLRQAGLDVVEA